MKIIEESLKRVGSPGYVNVKVEASLEDEFIWIDSDHLADTLMELEKNSIESMPNGGKLTIKVKEDKEKIYISINDTGTGITEQNLNCLLEPFFTTKSAGEGIGLGLPAAYAFVKSYRGELGIESNADTGKGPTGTTINITLPRRAAPGEKPVKFILHEDEDKTAG